MLQTTRTTMAPVSELDSLQRTLNQALDALHDEMTMQSLPDLSSCSAQRHPMDEPSFLCSPRLYEARKLALAAMGEIKALIQYPFEKVVEQAGAVHDTACLDIFIKAGIVDLLAEPSALKNGVEILDMQKTLDMDATKLTVILRVLSSQGWLHEPKEGTFKLARPALELTGNHGGRVWALNPGRPAMAQALMAQLTHPEWKYSRRANQTAFQIAHGTDLVVFDWLKEHPDEAYIFSKTIQAVGDAYHIATAHDFPWKKFEGRTFVDCAGGRGNLSIFLSQVIPKSRFIVQDLPEVIITTRENIATATPAAAQEGRITVEAVNLFDNQPRAGDDHIYLLRHTLHNWSDDACITVLKNIASVMAPASRIIILEVIMQPNTVHDDVAAAAGSIVTLDDLIGKDDYQPITPPAYIPANFGAAATTSLRLNIQMMAILNAQERSLREWNALITSAGLSIDEVYSFRGTISAIECKLDSQ
ncbi:S-adenosyl-L-methionine-dependent methyltransferase [Peniophora sp. CONT]|nr:S-adenosyl-L-methionine-dependent methyltransferase [Peniophora sp. CONT]